MANIASLSKDEKEWMEGWLDAYINESEEASMTSAYCDDLKKELDELKSKPTPTQSDREVAEHIHIYICGFAGQVIHEKAKEHIEQIVSSHVAGLNDAIARKDAALREAEKALSIIHADCRLLNRDWFVEKGYDACVKVIDNLRKNTSYELLITTRKEINTGSAPTETASPAPSGPP